MGQTVERCGKTTAPYFAQYPVRQNITKMLKTAEPYCAQEKKDVGKQLHPIVPCISTAEKLLHPTGTNKSKMRNINIKYVNYVVRLLVEKNDKV